MKLKDNILLNLKMARYNTKIIFANKFIYFLLAAVAIFFIIVIGNLMSGDSIRLEDIYNALCFTGILIVFYPVIFGIQNDKDARTLEIIFGVPDYRYRVWLMRHLMIYVITFFITLVMAWLIDLALMKYNIFSMALQVLFPIMFLGMLAFMVSTIARSGNATAAIMIIAGIALMTFADYMDLGYWNIFFNPYNTKISESAMQVLLLKNRIFLSAGSVLFFLGAMLNLQQREKFLG